MGIIGDSKSTAANVWGFWGSTLISDIDAAGILLGNRCEENLSAIGLRNWAAGGASVKSARYAIDGYIAEHSAETWQDHFTFLLNFGANDAGHIPFASEADWKADYKYIIDALLTKWPVAKIYIAKPWIRTQPANCNTIAGWIDDIIEYYNGTNPGHIFEGHDERIWFENGDNGTTYSNLNDGTHYNVLGANECIAQWKTVLGY